jgi:plasmid stability protein
LATTHTKLSISLPTDLVEVVRVAAAESGLTVSATIAAALRRTIEDGEQARLDAALDADRGDNLELARAYAPIAADLMAGEEW